MVAGFLSVFYNFGVKAVGKFNYALFCFSFEGLDLFVEFTVVFCVLCFVFLSESFHFKDYASELFDLLLVFLASAIAIVPSLAVQQFLVVLDA